MASDRGYITISRKAFSDSELLWQDKPFDRWRAMVDLIQLAAWRPYRKAIGNHIYDIQRGEFLASLRFLARRWGWGKRKVEGMISFLLERGTIRVQQRTPDGDTYLLVNYDTYQLNGDTEGTDNGTARGQQGDSKGTARGQREELLEDLIEDVKEKTNARARDDLDGTDGLAADMDAADDMTLAADELIRHGLHSRQAFECIRAAGGPSAAMRILAAWSASGEFGVGMLVSSLKAKKWLPERPRTGEEIARERAKAEWDQIPDYADLMRRRAEEERIARETYPARLAAQIESDHAEALTYGN